MHYFEYSLKRPSHNSRSYEYTNEEFRFVTSVVVKRTKLLFEYFDADIFGTHARGDIAWRRISAEKIMAPECIIFNFRKPENYAHFKLETIGAFLPENEFDPHFTFITPRYVEHNIRQFTKTQSISFLGCARNCQQTIVEAVELFEHLGKNFSDKQIVIFENDSTDGTDQILRDLQESGRIQLIQHQGLDEYFPKRTQRLAYARNALLSKASAAKVDYFCMADLDGVLGSLSSEFEHGFLSNFLYESVWDAVFPITLPNFYDLYAFRHPQLSDKDFELASNQTPSVLTYRDILEFQVGKFRRIRFEKMRGWLEVDSAFGGMGIYKAKSFSWSNYYGLNGEMEACEHIDFHQKAKMQGARLYINPEFVIGKK